MHNNEMDYFIDIAHDNLRLVMDYCDYGTLHNLSCTGKSQQQLAMMAMENRLRKQSRSSWQIWQTSFQCFGSKLRNGVADMNPIEDRLHVLQYHRHRHHLIAITITITITIAIPVAISPSPSPYRHIPPQSPLPRNHHHCHDLIISIATAFPISIWSPPLPCAFVHSVSTSHRYSLINPTLQFR